MNERFRDIGMPFGKHRGKCVRDVPIDYLHWVFHHIDLREPLRTAVAQELDSDRDLLRSGNGAIDIDAIYRKLSVDFHPDRQGGSVEGMRALNRVIELLRESL